VGVGAAAYLLLRPGRGRNFIFPAVGLVALASALAGGRSAFVFVVASGILLPVGIIWGVPPSLGAAYRLVKAIRRGFVVVALAAVMAVTFFPSATGSHLDFYRETILPDREHSETGARVWDYPVSQIEAALADPHWVMGHGIGTASLGIQYVSRILEVARPQIGAENGYAALDLELGIPGVICWLAWTVSLVIAAWQVVLKLKGTWAFPLGLAITWFAFLLLFPMTWGTIVEYQNYVANAYFWFLVGVLFRLPGLVAEDVNAPRVALAYSR
jgi:hypothetical protein